MEHIWNFIKENASKHHLEFRDEAPQKPGDISKGFSVWFKGDEYTPGHEKSVTHNLDALREVLRPYANKKRISIYYHHLGNEVEFHVRKA